MTYDTCFIPIILYQFHPSVWLLLQLQWHIKNILKTHVCTNFQVNRLEQKLKTNIFENPKI